MKRSSRATSGITSSDLTKRIVREDHMKKIAALILSIILCLTLLCACGRKTDENGNTLITSSWKCISYTVNDQHTELREQPLWVRLITINDIPKFKSSDGDTFTFNLVQKEYTGDLTLEEDGTYKLDTGKGKPLFGKIEGNTLTLYNEAGTVEMVFETN